MPFFLLIIYLTTSLQPLPVFSKVSFQPLLEEWNQGTEHYRPVPFIFYAHPSQGIAESPYTDPEAQDGWSLRLCLKSNATRGVKGSPGAESSDHYSYGVYWTRMKTANCSNQPNAGVVTGLFTYFNNGSDLNGNGIEDNSELDFEFLCATPELIYLSIWTDNSEVTGFHRRVYRVIDIRNGTILEQCYKEYYGDKCHQLSDLENQPTTIRPIPDFDSSEQYYNYGIIYELNRIRFVIGFSGEVHTLWDYQGPEERIPKNPMQFLYNIWHTDNWYPDSRPEAVESPVYPVNVYVDFSSIISIENRNIAVAE